VWSYGVVLYELFYQYSPFGKNTESETIAAIKDSPLEFPENALITLEAIDLISKCLEKDHDTRITIDRVLEHDFFKKQEQSLSQDKEYTLTNESDAN